MESLKEIGDTVFPDYKIEKEQLCFRPMTEHGNSFGPVRDVEEFGSAPALILGYQSRPGDRKSVE